MGHERRESSDPEPAEVSPEPSTDLPEVFHEVHEESGNPEEDSQDPLEEDIMPEITERMNYRNSVVSNFSVEIQEFESLDFRLDNRATIIKARDSSIPDLLDAALDEKLDNLVDRVPDAGDRGTIIFLPPMSTEPGAETKAEAEEEVEAKKEEQGKAETSAGEQVVEEVGEEEEEPTTPTQSHQSPPPPTLTVEDYQKKIVEV